jgi:hypothetical protein
MWKIDVMLWLILIGFVISVVLFSVGFLVMAISSATKDDIKRIFNRKL